MDEKLITNSLSRSNLNESTAETANNQSTNVRQSAQLQNILDNIPEAIVFINQEGRIQNMNTAAKFLLGEADELFELEEWPQKFGFYLDDALTHYPGHKMPLVRALQGETVQGEEMILRKDGSQIGVWVSMSCAPFQSIDGGVDGAIALLRDITYRKQIELSREKHAQRTEALYKLSRLIAEAGNDLNRITSMAASFT